METDLAIYGIFPKPVGICKFHRELNEQELNFITNLEKSKNIGNSISDIDDILSKEELAEIQTFIVSSLKGFFKLVYAPNDDVEIYITQSWVNFTNKGEYHHGHRHENSIISGVFYVKANPEIDKINFDKEPFGSGGEQIRLECATFNKFNSPTQEFKVGSGDLCLFPSNVYHHVGSSENEETRISISFNTFVKGNLGSRNKKTLLVL